MSFIHPCDRARLLQGIDTSDKTMFKYESWKRASSGHIHLKGKVNHFINMRRDCCGISPTFLCLRGSSGWDCLKRYSKLIQSTVTAQKCFASTACLVYTTWITQSSQPPWGTCRPSCWRWQRAAAWIRTVNLWTILCRRHWGFLDFSELIQKQIRNGELVIFIFQNVVCFKICHKYEQLGSKKG